MTDKIDEALWALSEQGFVDDVNAGTQLVLALLDQLDFSPRTCQKVLKLLQEETDVSDFQPNPRRYRCQYYSTCGNLAEYENIEDPVAETFGETELVDLCEDCYEERMMSR